MARQSWGSVPGDLETQLIPSSKLATRKDERIKEEKLMIICMEIPILSELIVFSFKLIVFSFKKLWGKINTERNRSYK